LFFIYYLFFQLYNPLLPFIDENVGNDVVLASADAANQSPIGAFIVRKENVTVGGAEIQFLNIVGIGFEGYNRSTRRANLTPGLRRR